MRSTIIDLLNNQFIALKINAEKEGESLAKKYAINGFPTFIILTKQGSFISRNTGAKNVDELKLVLTSALNNKTSLTDFQEAYSNGQKDSTFMLKYALYLIKNKMDAVQISDEYLSMVDKRYWSTPINFYIIRYALNYWESPYFKYVLDHKDLFLEQIKKDEIVSMIWWAYYRGILDVSGKKDKKLLRKLIQGIRKDMPSEKVKYFVLKAKANFFFVLHAEKKPCSFIKHNQRLFKKFPNASEMNAIAWNLQKNFNNTKLDKYALFLCQQSLEIDHNAYTLYNKAQIFIKLGKTAEGLIFLKETASMLATQKDEVTLYKEVLSAIQNLE